MRRQSLTAVLLLTTVLVSQAGASPAFRLEPGIPLEGELRGKAIHVYEVELAKGRSWRLEVTASGNRAL
ncbi:MAG: hypothetical protein GY842_01015, partial [bacterium]|nr:hypothetical protein [bacterium]